MRQMKIGFGVALGLLMVTGAIACASPTRAPESITEEEASAVLEAAHVSSLEQDLESLCGLGGSVLSCQSAWQNMGEWAAVPAAPPIVTSTRILPDLELSNGSTSRGGRVLVVDGIDGLGREFSTDFLLFDGGGGNLVALNPVYWSGMNVGRQGVTDSAPQGLARIVHIGNGELAGAVAERLQALGVDVVSQPGLGEITVSADMAVIFDGDWFSGHYASAEVHSLLQSVTSAGASVLVRGEHTSLLYESLQSAGVNEFFPGRNPAHNNPPLAGFRLKKYGDHVTRSHLSSNTSDPDRLVEAIARSYEDEDAHFRTTPRGMSSRFKPSDLLRS
jgi:hypothetical protein